MQRRNYRFLWAASLLVAFSLACNLLSTVGQDLNEARATGQAIATDVQSGRELLATGQAVATEFLGSEAIQTARAFATEEGSEILATLRAVATEEGPGLEATLEAFVTADAPGLVQTAAAIGTQAAPPSTNVPPGIPIWTGAIDDFGSNENLVSYIVPAPYAELLDFYQREMPANGWTAVESGTVVTDSSAVLNYDQPDRRAVVTLRADPANNQTIVLVTLQNK